MGFACLYSKGQQYFKNIFITLILFNFRTSASNWFNSPQAVYDVGKSVFGNRA